MRRRPFLIKDIIIAGLALIVIGILIIGIAYACAYRKTERVHIVSRWWDYSLAVKYRERDCGWGLDRYGEYSYNCKTETRTRCRTAATGQTWPPKRPEIPCPMREDDYISDYITYRLAYRIQETPNIKKTYIGRDQWFDLEPGVWLDITTGIDGRIMEIGR